MNVSEQKSFIRELVEHLSLQGKILIGDVAFETIEELNRCREESGDDWDNEEIYPVAGVLRADFPKMQFMKVSFCAGVLLLQKQS